MLAVSFNGQNKIIPPIILQHDGKIVHNYALNLFNHTQMCVHEFSYAKHLLMVEEEIKMSFPSINFQISIIWKFYTHATLGKGIQWSCIKNPHPRGSDR